VAASVTSVITGSSARWPEMDIRIIRSRVGWISHYSVYTSSGLSTKYKRITGTSAEDVAIPYACKERQRAYNREYRKRYYEKNKKKIKKRIYDNRRKQREKFREWKSTLECVKCGHSHVAALDFHHVVKKADNLRVNDLVRNGRFGKAYKEAAERCIVLCANCHRAHHWDEKEAKNGT